MKAFWVQMIDLDLFFRYLKGRCHGNQLKSKNRYFYDLFSCAAIQKRIAISQFRFQNIR